MVALTQSRGGFDPPSAHSPSADAVWPVSEDDCQGGGGYGDGYGSGYDRRRRSPKAYPRSPGAARSAPRAHAGALPRHNDYHYDDPPLTEATSGSSTADDYHYDPPPPTRRHADPTGGTPPGARPSPRSVAHAPSSLADRESRRRPPPRGPDAGYGEAGDAATADSTLLLNPYSGHEGFQRAYSEYKRRSTEAQGAGAARQEATGSRGRARDPRDGEIFRPRGGPDLRGTAAAPPPPRDRSRPSRSRGGGRSRSRGARVRSSSRSRGASRSTSRGPGRQPPQQHEREGGEHAAALFRGAAVIRDQLLRSLASADERMDQARNEIRAAPGVDGGVDFDYSRGYLGPRDRDAREDSRGDRQIGSGSRGASQGSSNLESESRRLDDLVHIFTAGSMSTTSGGRVRERSMEMELGDPAASPRSGVRVDTGHERGEDVEDHNGRNYEDQRSPRSLDARPQGRPQDGGGGREMHGGAIEPSVIKGCDVPSGGLLHASPTGLAQELNVARQSSNRCDPSTNYANRYLNGSGSSKPTPAEPSAPRPANPKEEALSHASHAGPLWRSLVGSHVRFPAQWESLLPPSSPTIGRPDKKWSRWYYTALHRVKRDERLNSDRYGVRSRRTGGRILLHAVVREAATNVFAREIAVGIFHPNSKGIRAGKPLPEVEDVREVWMGIRWVVDGDAAEPPPSVDAKRDPLDTFLVQRRGLDPRTMGSPLGDRKAVNNGNVRDVFGDQPPLNTVDLHEDELVDILKSSGAKKGAAVCPALLLLRLFLFPR